MGADVNLTKYLTRIVTWKHVQDIELYDIVGAIQKFAYCSDTMRCLLAKGVDSSPVFWNRLKQKNDSILLTGIQEDDEGLEMEVKIHFKTGSAPRTFTLRIRLDAPQGEFPLEYNVTPFFPFNISLFHISQIRWLKLK